MIKIIILLWAVIAFILIIGQIKELPPQCISCGSRIWGTPKINTVPSVSDGNLTSIDQTWHNKCWWD